VRVPDGRRARTEAVKPRSVTTRSRIVAFAVACLTVIFFSALPAAAGNRASHKDGRAKVGAKEKKTHRAGADSRAKHRKKKGPKFADLDSLVATVEGVSVGPDAEPQVKGTRLHRPANEAYTATTQAAGSDAPAPSSGKGMLDFLVVALLLSSLAAWLVRQVGPLKN